MQRRATYDYIYLGAVLRGLRHLPAGTEVGAPDADRTLVFHLRTFERMLGDVNLPVTQRAFQQNLAELTEELTAAGSGTTLSQDQATRLDTGFSNVYTTLAAEASGVYAYVVRDKRISTDTLLTNPGALFGKGVFQALPQIAQHDFRDAARCIAFELPTSAAFHLMRGTEAVLKDLYHAVVKRQRLERPMWGAMIQALRSRKTDPPPKVLLDHLDALRENFRNPTQHPDKEYDTDEALDLWSVSVDVVNRMIRAKPGT